MNRLERKAALAVAAAAAGIVVSGVSLLKKHTKYMTQKAAATFDPQEEEDWFDEAEAAAEDAVEKAGEAAAEDTVEKAGEKTGDAVPKEAAAEENAKEKS